MRRGKLKVIDKQVSFPGDRIKYLYREVMLNLFSQSGHPCVERMVKDILSPDFAEDLLPRHNAVFITQQIYQQLEFTEFQTYFLPVPYHLVGVKVQGKIGSRQQQPAIAVSRDN